ncbi:MAG: hypothetical protein ABSF21_00215 [Dehalococcoidia bacterium]|jgi:hypothetical protein
MPNDPKNIFYHEAIRKQLDMAESLSNNDVGSFSSVIEYPNNKEKYNFKKMFISSISNAEPFWVSRQIEELVLSASENLPPVPLTRELFPVPNGFIYFEQPIELSDIKQSMMEINKLRAICWDTSIASENSIQGILLMLMLWDRFDKKLKLWVTQGWVFGDSYDAIQHDDALIDNPKAYERLSKEIWNKSEQRCRKIFLTLLCFIKQRLFTTIKTPGTNALYRKPINKPEPEVPLINIITLRPKTTVLSGEHRDVDWQYRWLVRGHWRQQWYRSDNTHRAIWITPYIKGPENKPLKKPSVNLFAVIR